MVEQREGGMVPDGSGLLVDAQNSMPIELREGWSERRRAARRGRAPERLFSAPTYAALRGQRQECANARGASRLVASSEEVSRLRLSPQDLGELA